MSVQCLLTQNFPPSDFSLDFLSHSGTFEITPLSLATIPGMFCDLYTVKSNFYLVVGYLANLILPISFSIALVIRTGRKCSVFLPDIIRTFHSCLSPTALYLLTYFSNSALLSLTILKSDLHFCLSSPAFSSFPLTQYTKEAKRLVQG